MELKDMLEISPSDYLQKGYLTEDRKLREEINGLHSLAIAYQCREEAVNLDRFRDLVQFAESKDFNLPLLRERFESLRCRALKNLLQASEGWISDSRQYAAFVSHLRRILNQTALLVLTPAE